VYGKNIFDEEYDAEGYWVGFYVINSLPGEMRIQLVYRF